jgi:hypothetical protein
MKALQITGRTFALLMVIILLLALVLGLGLRDFVRTNIVIPVSYVLWIGGLLVKSTPQVLFWGVLVGVAAFLALRSLGTVTGLVEKVDEAEPRYTRRGRIGFWTIQLYHAQQSFFRMRFEEFFARLILDVIAFEEQTDPIELERRMEDGTFEPPEELRVFLRLRRGLANPHKIGFFTSLRQRLWWLGNLGRQEQGPAQPGSIDRPIEEALAILEDQLEVKHDHANQ